jgi:hypothetical protein
MIVNILMSSEAYFNACTGTVEATEDVMVDLVDTWDECVASVKRDRGDNWSIDHVVDLMESRGFHIELDHSAVELFA